MKVYKKANIKNFEDKLHEAQINSDRIIVHFNKVLYSLQLNLNPITYLNAAELPFALDPKKWSTMLIVDKAKYEKLFSPQQAIIRRLADRWIEDWERFLLHSFVDEETPHAPEFTSHYVKTNIYAVKPTAREIDNDPTKIALEGLQIYREDLYSTENVWVNIYNLSPQIEGFIYVIKEDNIYEFELMGEGARWHFISIDEKEFIADKAVFAAQKALLQDAITISEAAKLLKCNKSDIEKDILSGKFKLADEVRRSGSTWLISKKAIERVYMNKET